MNEETETSIEQCKVQESVLKRYSIKRKRIALYKKEHLEFVVCGLLRPLSRSFISLDASRPWILYWNLNSLSLLTGSCKNAISMLEERKPGIIQSYMHFLTDKCFTIQQISSDNENVCGGFGGGPSQIPHLATSFAAISAISIMVKGMNDEAQPEISKSFSDENLLLISTWLKSLKTRNGAFLVHIGGEVDLRGSYCALVIASRLGLFPWTNPEMAAMAEYILSSLTYEGGFGSGPAREAHGGYTYCALAALYILQEHYHVKLYQDEHYLVTEGTAESIFKWLSHKQMCLEGGFCGRTNKLVDGCYSFWVGASFEVLRKLTAKKLPPQLFDASKLIKYVIECCQCEEDNDDTPCGGLLDKPDKAPDFYHTCYVLAGLTLADPNFNYLSASVDGVYNICL